jgi:YidC/Oxa1 family membrane protein insertase
MAEFRNPGHEGRAGMRWFVFLIVILTCMSVGLRRFSATSGASTVLAHASAMKADGAKGASQIAPGSMNVFERVLFAMLAFVHTHVVAGWSGSWGWAIVLLTVGINLLVLPLRIASMRSGVKMQRIQPEVEAIKARYKDVKLTDPRHNEMAAEIAKLQREHGVNLFGGCVPLLIQMPVLFAFFGMLRNAVVLRGAGWFWLHDLSLSDPYHILPILMVVLQMAVQLYTPSPGADAKQQKMMAYLMAVVFGYISWHYASGLALYAVTGSLFSIATQLAMNQTALGREMKVLRAMGGAG